MGDAVDGCRHGAAEPVRADRAMGSASGVRVRRGCHVVLGRDGADAGLHALSARGCGGRSVVVLALASVRRGGGPAARALRVSLAACTGLAPASDHGVFCADDPLRRRLRPRTADGDGSGACAATAQLAAGHRDSAQFSRDRRGHPPGSRAGRGRCRGDLERKPALVGRGQQLGFGFSAPLQPWFAGAGGVVLLALALNTGAALPIYWSLVFGSGRRLDRLREAWSNYWALFRGLVIPSCALFGVVVFRLLASG